MTQGEDTDAAIPWIPAFCRAGLAALSLASAEGGEADALRRIVTGPFAVGVATRANDVLWLAIEVASSTGFVTIAHGEAFVELPPETVKPIRAALAPAAFSFFAEVRALRGAGRLSVVRHRRRPTAQPRGPPVHGVQAKGRAPGSLEPPARLCASGRERAGCAARRSLPG